VEDFPTRLRRLREAKGITPYRLAQLTGLSKQGVLNLERSDADPRLSTLWRLAEALGVHPAELLPGAHRPGTSQPSGVDRKRGLRGKRKPCRKVK
jgi:transcriptional regulator with XRE-family HTH domain